MDESSLLDLLECSVCLERLDTTAKVLPCQHTFCRRCVTLLPTLYFADKEAKDVFLSGNVILPGGCLNWLVRQGWREGAADVSGGSVRWMCLSAQSTNSGQEPAQGWFCIVRRGVSQLPYGKALYTYEGKEPGDLKFNKGDIIILRRKVDENWYHGELNGNHGFFPASYIQCIKPLPQAPPQGKALYDFEIKDKDQDKDCLTFTKVGAQVFKKRSEICFGRDAAHLNGDVGGGPLGGPAAPGPAAKPEERKNEKKKSGLLKLLAGASTKKKSRSPPSVSPTHDPQPAIEGVLQGAVGPELSSLSSHGRAGSCPIESEMQGAMGLEPLHRKTGSLDLNFSIPSPARPPLSSMAAIRPEPKPLPRERYRVVVPYPPQSEAEIELKEGDIVFVHKKREDGWYKGTLQRNGRTGLFPGSFVESF
uniref:RING-type E3 ubiquitin transferase n=1 Tax=Ficedula albicollis TaxID=59894 RepID=A0A803VZC0_FICAL